MAGLMGNVEGYEIDSSKIDSPVLYVGLGGGFSDYGSWYENEVGKQTRRLLPLAGTTRDTPVYYWTIILPNYGQR